MVQSQGEVVRPSQGGTRGGNRRASCFALVPAPSLVRPLSAPAQKKIKEGRKRKHLTRFTTSLAVIRTLLPIHEKKTREENIAIAAHALGERIYGVRWPSPTFTAEAYTHMGARTRTRTCASSNLAKGACTRAHTHRQTGRKKKGEPKRKTQP